MVGIPHHEATREYSDGPLKDAHVDVHLKDLYILALKKGRGKGDHGRIVGSHKLFHQSDLNGRPAGLSSDLTSV